MVPDWPVSAPLWGSGGWQITVPAEASAAKPTCVMAPGAPGRYGDVFVSPTSLSHPATCLHIEFVPPVAHVNSCSRHAVECRVCRCMICGPIQNFVDIRCIVQLSPTGIGGYSLAMVGACWYNYRKLQALKGSAGLSRPRPLRLPWRSRCSP